MEMQVCARHSQEVVRPAIESRLPSNCVMGEQVNFCFRVHFPKHGPDFSALSISVPSDAMGNRAMDFKGRPYVPTTIETLLFNGDDTASEADCDRFWSIDDVISHLERMAAMAQEASAK